jgi:hypothetical protein
MIMWRNARGVENFRRYFFSSKSVNEIGHGVSPGIDHVIGLQNAILGLQKLKGESITVLKQKGYSAPEIWIAGYSLKKLKKVFKINQLTWFTLLELKEVGFSAKELKEIGYTASILRYHGFPLKQLKKAGFTAKEMLEARVSHKDMLALGYQRDEMVDAELQSLRENSIFKRFKFQ